MLCVRYIPGGLQLFFFLKFPIDGSTLLSVFKNLCVLSFLRGVYNFLESMSIFTAKSFEAWHPLNPIGLVAGPNVD